MTAASTTAALYVATRIVDCHADGQRFALTSASPPEMSMNAH